MTDFFLEYVRLNRPLLIRDAVSHWSAFDFWADARIIDTAAAEAKVDIELKMKEDRSGAGVHGSLLEYITLSRRDAGLEPLGDEDSSKLGSRSARTGYVAGNRAFYLINSIPQSLRKHMSLPLGLRHYSLYLREPSLWMSSTGNTSSVLHNDGEDNLNCVISGEKRLVLMNASYSSHVNNTGHHAGYGMRSTIDVDAVDLEALPRVQETTWYDVLLRAGDCVYIPYAWMHAVRSPVGRSTAANVWFMPRLQATERSCRQHLEAIEGMQDSWSRIRAGEEASNEHDDIARLEDKPELEGLLREVYGERYLDACVGTEAEEEEQEPGMGIDAGEGVDLDRFVPLSDPVWAFLSDDIDDMVEQEHVPLAMHREQMWSHEVQQGVGDGNISPERGERLIKEPPWSTG